MNETVEGARTAYDGYRLACDPARAGDPWLVTERRSVSFGELRERIERMAGWLQDKGLSVGERVVISSRDDAETSLLFVALVCNGITAINLDPDTSAERARSLVRRADARLLLLDRELSERWMASGSPGGALPGEWVEIAPPVMAGGGGLLGRLFGAPAAPEGSLQARLARARTQPPPALLDPETLAYILFTSGTTDQPKGVCISHRALFAHLRTLSRRFGYDAGSRILNTLMLSHTDGMTQGPMIAFHNRIPVYRPLRFEVTSVEALLDAVYRLRISHMVAVPTMLALMLRLGQEQRDAFQGGDFRLLVSCAAQLEQELWRQFQAFFQVPLVNVYGLTETVTGGLFAGPDAGSGVPGSIGKPMDCEVRIVDADGVDLAAGEPGELLMRGELLMSGYFGDPGLTASTLAEGWLRTGDIARRDADGLYRIIGRVKSIIIRGGYNISPEEVSEALQRHAGVREAVAFGVPDPTWGEVVAALVVAEPGLDEDALRQHCASQLEPWKVPARIARVAALPRGRSGKVLLDEARRQFDADDGPVQVRGRVDGDMASRLLAVAAASFKTDPGRLNLLSTPRDVPGWDSLAHMELVAALEREFGVELGARDIMALDRLDKALAMVAG